MRACPVRLLGLVTPPSTSSLIPCRHKGRGCGGRAAGAHAWSRGCATRPPCLPPHCSARADLAHFRRRSRTAVRCARSGRSACCRPCRCRRCRTPPAWPGMPAGRPGCLRSCRRTRCVGRKRDLMPSLVVRIVGGCWATGTRRLQRLHVPTALPPQKLRARAVRYLRRLTRWKGGGSAASRCVLHLRPAVVWHWGSQAAAEAATPPAELLQCSCLRVG